MTFVPNNISQLNSGFTKVVPVLASFDSAGNVRPVYVRLNTEAFKILSCTNRSRGPLMDYFCIINNHGRQQDFTLTYHSRENCWTTQL